MLTENNEHEKSLPGPLKEKDSKADIVIDINKIEILYDISSPNFNKEESKQIAFLACMFNSKNIFDIFHPPQNFLS